MFTEIGSVFPRDVHLIPNKILNRTIRGGLVDGRFTNGFLKV